MKLGFISDLYSPNIGGSQILAQSLAEGFKNLGHEIEVVTSPNPERDHSKYQYKINEVEFLNFSNSDFFLVKNYDAIFVFADLLSPTLSTITPSHTKNSILILNLDENIYNFVQDKNIKQIVQNIKSYTHVVSFCQGAPVNKFLEENEINYHFIPNFSRDILKSKKSKKITKELLGVQGKMIFNHGRFHPNKNIHKMIEAFSSSKLTEDFSLVILGAISDPACAKYLNYCNSIINSNGMKDKIKIIKGTTNNVVVDSLLSIADVFMLPSPSEGLPLVLIEAMSAGLPWISTPAGGVPAVFGKHSGGVVLDSVDFSAEDMQDAVYRVLDKNPRNEWEENYNIDLIIKKYAGLIKAENTSVETIDFLKNYKISFGNQVYNEPIGIKNYLQSCMQFAGIVDEVYIINHRSSDNTLEIIESFKEKYDEIGISLRWRTEPRDFSKDFTIADVFGAAVYECKNEIVFRHDADFIFGKGYLKTMADAIRSLNLSTVYACGYEIPVVSKSVSFENGTVRDYGICNMHVSVPRVFKKSKTKCLQNHVGGKYEWFHPTDQECTRWVTLPHNRESLLSVNVKPQDRQDLRETMNTFMQDLQSGKAEGSWLENNNLRREKEEWADASNDMKKINIKGNKYEF